MVAGMVVEIEAATSVRPVFNSFKRVERIICGMS